MKEPVDYVACIGHFLAKDEDIYTFFEPELAPAVLTPVRSHVTPPVRTSVSKLPTSKSLSREDRLKKQGSMSVIETNSSYHGSGDVFQSRVIDRRMSLQEGSLVLDLQGTTIFLAL